MKRQTKMENQKDKKSMIDKQTDKRQIRNGQGRFIDKQTYKQKTNKQ